MLELNEAFASQSLAVLRELGLPDDAEHVNPNGGAIALGHPLGAPGARLALTAALELRDRAARHAVATMCIGVGQGIAALLEPGLKPRRPNMTDTNTTGTDPGTAGLAHDYLDLDSLFSAEELALRDRVREFVAKRIRPNIAAWCRRPRTSRARSSRKWAH